MGTDLSIIIPTYKRHASLKQTLLSVAQHRPQSSEVIVVDQSPDNKKHAAAFQQDFPFVTYICSSRPGLPRARNTGIAHSNSPVILFIDDDMLLHPQCCATHLALHAQNNISVIAGRIVQSNRSPSWASTPTVAAINQTTGETTGNFDLDYSGTVLYATGGHLSLKKEIISIVGLFNPRFIGNALFEDIDFSCRARSKGLTIWYTPQAIVYHSSVTTGGCHDSHETRYLQERLHNHCLFYFLHIRFIPKKEYIVYMKNLIEYISRKSNKCHSSMQVISCLTFIVRAYYDTLVSRLIT